MRKLAVFGGAFDPVHNGHIQCCLHLQAHFHFDNFFIVPCKIPVLKAASLATAEQRVAMLEKAFSPWHDFTLDLREIQRASPSYMVETLISFRDEYPQDSITLIMGYDALLTLPQWHQWEELIRLANLLIINRASSAQEPLPTVVNQLIHNHISKTLDTVSGSILMFDAGNYPIASTKIRDSIRLGRDIKDMLPDSVYEYIVAENIYK